MIRFLLKTRLAADVNVILWDIDGTLLLTGGAGQKGMERALEKVFGVTKPTDEIPAAGRTDFAITHDLFEFHGIDNTPQAWEQFSTEYFRQLPLALAELDGSLLPGVREALEALHPRDDVRMGLLTGNFEEGAWLKLKHYKINHYFQFGAFGDSHHCRDDVARLAYEATHQHCGSPIAADRVWVIGDTPADVACARSIGANVVAVATGVYSYDELAPTKPDLLLHDLTDLDTLLARLT